MDENMIIRQAVDTGSVVLGARRSEKVLRKKAAKMLIIASNCPEFAWLKAASLKVHRYKGNSLDLGAACGKPYSVAVLAVLSPGESNILNL